MKKFLTAALIVGSEPNQQDKAVIVKKLVDEEKIFLFTQKVDEGWKIYSKDDYSGAAKLFDEAVQLNSNNAGAYFGRGTIYDDLKQYERAIADYNKALELNPSLAEAYNNRGYAYTDLGQYDAAIKIEPNYGYAYWHRGKCHEAKGDRSKAQADFAKARELGYSE